MAIYLGRHRGRQTAAVVASAAAILALLLNPAVAVASPTSAPPTSAPTGRISLPPAHLAPVNVPGTTALGAAAVSLSKYGYTEREFYADGLANRYRGAVGAAAQNATVIDSNNPYRTRVLVRTPSPARFNGTLIVEWTNVTIGVDADFVFAEASSDFLRQGYAYAVVSAQQAGVARDVTWSPRRYGSLSVAASNADPQGGTVDASGDPLSWDIFTQISEALKINSGPNAPLPGLHVRNVIATGQSQSASRLTTYYNTIQPLDNFFDGFVFWDRATAKLRSDVAVPSVSVNSEGLTPFYPLPFGTSTYTREWEVAGSTHGSTIAEQYVDAMFNRDKSKIGQDGNPESFTQWVEPSCVTLPAFSPVPNGLVIAAATDQVKTWIQTGRPASPSISFNRDGSGQLVRDANGHVTGGIQLSQFAVPTAQILALNGTGFP